MIIENFDGAFAKSIPQNAPGAPEGVGNMTIPLTVPGLGNELVLINAQMIRHYLDAWLLVFI
jgi:hypothetical protein